MNQIDNEIDAIENQDAKLFFKLTNSVTNDLFEMNIIDFPRPEEVKRYLLDNEKDFYIYRIKNDKYHIICDLIRFICTIDKGNGTIVLIRANELESYSAQEKVISRAFQIKVEIEFSSYSSSERHRMYLFKFLEKVDYEYQDFINRKKNRETEDRLISVWSKKIKQQETLLQKKKM